MGWTECEREMRKRASDIARACGDDHYASVFYEDCPRDFAEDLERHDLFEEYLYKFFSSYEMPEVADSLEQCSKNGNFPDALEAIIYQMLGEEDTTETPAFARLLTSEQGMRLTSYMHVEQSFAYVKDGVESLATLCERSAKYEEDVFDYLLHENHTGIPNETILDTFDKYKTRDVTWLMSVIHESSSHTLKRKHFELFERDAVVHYIGTEKSAIDAIETLSCFLVDNSLETVHDFAQAIGQYEGLQRKRVNEASQTELGDPWEMSNEVDELTEMLEHGEFKHVMNHTRGENRMRLLRLGFQMLGDAYSGRDAAYAMAVCNVKGKQFYDSLRDLMKNVPDQDWIWSHVFENPRGIGPATLKTLPTQYKIERQAE